MADSALAQQVADLIYRYQYSGEAPDLILSAQCVQAVHDWQTARAREIHERGWSLEFTMNGTQDELLFVGRIFRVHDGAEYEYSSADGHEIYDALHAAALTHVG